MLTSGYQRLQQIVFSQDVRVRGLALGLALAAGALGIALFVGIVGPLLALAVAVAIVSATLILNDTHWGFVALAAVLFLFPFGSLPFSIGFKPTFLDAALGALFFVWVLKLVTGQEREFIASPLGLSVALFMMMALFSFANGLTHSAANSFLIRRFVEILIGIALFFVAVNTVRTIAEIRWVTRWLMLGGAAGGAVAVLFYLIPQDATVWVLNRLARFDYPGGYGALRWIEDDPSGTMRAIGTAVDPNVLGGMMIVVTGLLLPQLLGGRRLFAPWLIWSLFVVAALALYLTYSRSALLGLISIIAFLAALKFRRLIPLGAAAALLVLAIPQTRALLLGSGYVERLLAGFAGEDLATQMRFGEYKDALILIGRYPLFGVGFTGVPDIDIYLGVSMLYLILAENMGIVGLLFFLAVVIGFFVRFAHAWRRGFDPALENIVLGYAGALVGALVSGIFDHYWFNMTYPHMTVLFWLFMGLASAAVLIQDASSATDGLGPEVEDRKNQR